MFCGRTYATGNCSDSHFNVVQVFLQILAVQLTQMLHPVVDVEYFLMARDTVNFTTQHTLYREYAVAGFPGNEFRILAAYAQFVVGISHDCCFFWLCVL